MAEKTKEEWGKMDWNKQVTHRVNDHHTRIEDLEKLVEKLSKNLKPKTVDDLAGNRKEIDHG